jgi:hypothetical protein
MNQLYGGYVQKLWFIQSSKKPTGVKNRRNVVAQMEKI